MAERISKHCWATAKCGIITAITHFEFDKEIDFEFVIVRNPYRRIASFYISKVIEHGTMHGRENVIPHIKSGNLNCTFEEMVPLIKLSPDRHLELQKFDRDNIYFVRCENWIEDIAFVCKKLDIDQSHYENVWENRSSVTEAITEYVGNKPASWFEENGNPSNYNLLYNGNTKKLVYDLYKPDFDWLENVYDDLEVF